MTYIDQKRRFWPFGRLHCVAASNAVPAEHRVVTWAQYLVAEAPRILNKKPRTANADRGVLFRSLAMTYSHMGNPHTTIGDDTFHF